MKEEYWNLIIGLIAICFLITIGILITSAIANDKGMNTFVIVNKEFKPEEYGNFLGFKFRASLEEYRIYYETNKYVLTTQEDYAKYQIGDLFNGSRLMYG